MSEKVNVVITDDYSDHESFIKTVDAMQEAGLTVDEQMEEIGVVSGSIEPEKLDVLRQISGVSSVEEDRTYQLPAPWSKTQ